jgi:tetratricopeptide (TPR) repeat protein
MLGDASTNKRERPVTQPRGKGSARPAKRPEQVPVQRTRQELWQANGWEEDDTIIMSDDAVAESPKPPKVRPSGIPDAISKELNTAAGSKRAPKLEASLMDASRAFEHERYGDALTTLRALSAQTPDIPAILELTGLCLYRQGKWSDALRQLDRFIELTGSVEQHPVLADCHRALRHFGEVVRYWDELAASSPSAELVAEGRIVMAGAFADQGKLREAISLVERAQLQTKRPRTHHLRLWYTLGDLYERAGDVPSAREWFARILLHDADMADTAERLENL